MPDLVSVIIPVYNTGNRLWKCVDSIVNQTYPYLEIFIIDDGSNKETAEICDAIANRYEMVQTFHYGNAGVSVARNYGIDKAQGKYIYFADGDDYAETNMLESMINVIEKGKAKLVVSGYYIDIPVKKKHGNYNMSIIEQKGRDIVYANKDEIKKHLVDLWDSSLMYNVWNKLFSTELIRNYQIRFPENKAFNEDRDFVREYLMHTDCIALTEKSYYHYSREDEMAATGKYYNDMLEIRKEEYWNLIKFFSRMGVDETEYIEYVSREHFDRVVGCIENLFHGKTLKKRDIKKQIIYILNDDDTKSVIYNEKPKSKKMKMLRTLFMIGNIETVYWVFASIYHIRKSKPDIFYKMKQSR